MARLVPIMLSRWPICIFKSLTRLGQSLFGPAANNTLWSGFGGACQTQNAGDPVVLYDQLADRWLLTQFTAGSAPFFECVALSQTNDPTGTYYRWAIATGPSGNNFPDYPKAGMWPDAYYFSTREFAGGTGGPFAGVGAYALDRVQALAGNPNPTMVGFLQPPSPAYIVGDGLLPSDLDGQATPPPGSPNYFVGSQDNNGPYGAPQDALNICKFHYDPMTPGNSTFMLTNTLPTASFQLDPWLYAVADVIVFRSQVPPIESIIWAIDSGRCFGLPIATLARMSRW